MKTTMPNLSLYIMFNHLITFKDKCLALTAEVTQGEDSQTYACTLTVLHVIHILEARYGCSAAER